ncbi:AAEL017167-PA, partial [Aedes aegypti]
CENTVAEHYRLKNALKFIFEETSSEIYHFKGINSTEMCLPQDAYDSLKWPAARIGQTIAPLELCLIEASGLPLTRKCAGDRTYGGVWQQNHDFYACSKTVKKHTLQLFNYTEIPVNVAEMGQVMGEIEHVMDSAADMIPADLFYISKTMNNLRSALLNNGSNNVALIDNNRERCYCDIAGILNRVMYMNESVVLRSQVALNTTNILLDSTDDIINRISVVNSTVDFLRGDNLNCFDELGQQFKTDSILEKRRGTILFKTPRLILLVVDPLIAADEDENEIIMEENLEIAAYVPAPLLEKISMLNEHIGDENGTNQNVLRIVISVYFNDNIFKETTNGTILRANGKIISVTIPSYSSDLPGEIPIFIRDHDRNQTSSCGYWNFEPDDNEVMPKWSFGGCKFAHQHEGIMLCKCSHLTPFSRLCMDIQHIESDNVLQKFIGERNIFTLDVITFIGSALSLMGVFGIFITAFLFPTWRQTAHSKILLQLSLAITFELIIIFLDGPDINYNDQSGRIQCTLLGGSFHYIILVTFMWMLVIAYLQFLRYVKVLGRLRPSRFILKASLFSWGLPLVPVIVFTAVDYTLYHKQDNISDICYPHGVALYYGLLLPIAVIILVNMASFLLIIYYVFRVPSNLTRSSERDLTLSQVRLSVFLFFLLGLPWIFGMMITIGAGKIFSYLFCITAPLQGFILFVYFIIMNPMARKFWCSRCSRNELAKSNIDMPLK